MVVDISQFPATGILESTRSKWFTRCPSLDELLSDLSLVLVVGDRSILVRKLEKAVVVSGVWFLRNQSPPKGTEKMVPRENCRKVSKTF